MAIYDEIDIVGLVRAREAQLQNGLRRLAGHPLVGEVRGIGLMGALEFVADKAGKTPFEKSGRLGARIAADLQAQGILLRALGDTLVVAPPLVVSEDELAQVLDALETTLTRIAEPELA
ncbi:aminotransferase class III-fold pyridoxal phosphate-dependent enzyme [Mesorhizobium sp. M2D.F.Ca.ET.223.01.1.1]|nr:aminotransferase class III-fold pyridoxal phosphate-dependent enzyme [Mesorhizobium sp. M2D.F.Ca.ET.223.01.1.1]